MLRFITGAAGYKHLGRFCLAKKTCGLVAFQTPASPVSQPPRDAASARRFVRPELHAPRRRLQVVVFFFLYFSLRPPQRSTSLATIIMLCP
jgi:hypothetical protein